MTQSESAVSVTAVLVHYRTFDLTRMAIWSLRSLYPSLPLLVVENGSHDGSREKLYQLGAAVSDLNIIESDRHVHHGPGMHRGIGHVATDWILLCDTDCILYRHGVLEAMMQRISEATYMIGEEQRVDADGFPAGDAEGAFRYIHPFFALVRRSMYAELPPFEKHGAPCLANEKAARRRAFGLTDFPVREYVFHFGRGTVDQHGYGLGYRGQYLKLKKLYRRVRGMFR
jgi:hypothetical protein